VWARTATRSRRSTRSRSRANRLGNGRPGPSRRPLPGYRAWCRRAGAHAPRLPADRSEVGADRAHAVGRKGHRRDLHRPRQCRRVFRKGNSAAQNRAGSRRRGCIQWYPGALFARSRAPCSATLFCRHQLNMALKSALNFLSFSSSVTTPHIIPVPASVNPWTVAAWSHSQKCFSRWARVWPGAMGSTARGARGNSCAAALRQDQPSAAAASTTPARCPRQERLRSFQAMACIWHLPFVSIPGNGFPPGGGTARMRHAAGSRPPKMRLIKALRKYRDYGRLQRRQLQRRPQRQPPYLAAVCAASGNPQRRAG
jgi:hypothetical protein